MNIRFSRHATQKFQVLKHHGVRVEKSRVIEVLQNPEHVDAISRSPLLIAQGPLDARRVLRVVYKIEYGMMVVITFYPGRRSRYED